MHACLRDHEPAGRLPWVAEFGQEVAALAVRLVDLGRARGEEAAHRVAYRAGKARVVPFEHGVDPLAEAVARVALGQLRRTVVRRQDRRGDVLQRLPAL